METKQIMSGYAIAVVDKGFVYVGGCEHDGEWCVIKDARNIRIWGTSEGLGELALKGPLDDTKLDSVGTVRIPAHALISLIDTVPEKWIS